MSEATSKAWRVHKSSNLPTMDAVDATTKNRGMEVSILMPDNAPYKYKYYEFWGEETPDGTLYPDTIAPIGSRYHKLILTSGVVTGYLEYIKTAAATWTAIGAAT